MSQETDNVIQINRTFFPLEMHFRREDMFGLVRLYPNCKKAKAICELMRTKTFLQKDIKHLKILGFKVYIDHEGAVKCT